jgi:hypothetical protein
VKLFEKWGWKKIATIQQTTEVFTSVSRDWGKGERGIYSKSCRERCTTGKILILYQKKEHTPSGLSACSFYSQGNE